MHFSLWSKESSKEPKRRIEWRILGHAEAVDLITWQLEVESQPDRVPDYEENAWEVEENDYKL